MNNMQATTAGFVLTSLSFQQTENKKASLQTWQQTNMEHRSSIAKFDYCLPPDEFINTATTETRHSA